MSSPDRHLSDPDPAARPRSLAQRLQLLLILLVLPVAAVTLPALAVTGIFGRTPKTQKPPVHAKPAPTPDAGSLKAALDHSAESLLPTPAPLSPDTIRVLVRADHLDARAAKVASQAKALGGTAVAGIAAAGERHLFVDLPAGRAEAFRQAVTRNEPSVVPTGAPATGAARDQVEVVIRPTPDDE